MTSRTSLTHSLSVIPLPTPDTFTCKSLWRPRGARGVFGGQVIALALVAAGETVSHSMGLHSQHCYFILPANADIQIIFEVERLRDGRSYTNRLVRAKQDGKVVFVLSASYAVPPIALGGIGGDTPFSFTPASSGLTKEPSVSHTIRFALDDRTKKQRDTNESGSALSGAWNRQTKGVGKKGNLRRKEDTGIPPFTPRWHIPFPDDVVPYEDSEEEDARWDRFLNDPKSELEDKARKSIAEYIQERKESPVRISVARSRNGGSRNSRMIWLRPRLLAGEKPTLETIKAMIAYMTDFQFIGTASRSVGLTIGSKPRLGMLASLDHTTHYYPFPPDFNAEEPILHVMEAAITDLRSGRGIVRGLVYTKEGWLLAVTQQEGVVRADMGREGRGLVEGGGMGEGGGEEERQKVKARL